MAPPVNKPLTAARIWALWSRPSSGRLAFAARIALISALVLIATELYTTPAAALTVYMVFFVNKQDRASSIALSIAMVIVITIVVGILLLIATPLLSNSGYRVAAMTFFSVVLLFLASASKLKPLGAIVALVIVYALDVMGTLPVGEFTTRGLLYAWLFIGIPAAVSVVVNLLMAPSPREMLQRELASALRIARNALSEQTSDAKRDLVSLISQGDEEIQSHLKLAALEKTSSHEEMVALQGAADGLLTILSSVSIMVQDRDASPPDGVRRSIEATLTELADSFDKGAYPRLVAHVGAETADSELAQSCIEAFNIGLNKLWEVKPETAHQNTAKAGFFLPDAFSNPEHVRYALKSTAAAMLCYLTYSLLDWRGIHTALITCYIVSLPTVAETVEKLTLRISGCLIGCGIGLAVLIVILPSVTSIGTLALIVFLVIFFAAWTAGGSPRISYAGYQIAFAFLLCVVQSNEPAFDLAVARDRVVGILFGNLVSYLVASYMWPATIAWRIDVLLGKAREQLSTLARTKDHWQMLRMAADTHALLATIKEDIQLVAYEPRAIRPSAKWLTSRSAAVESAQSFVSPLLIATELGRSEATEAALGILDGDCFGEHRVPPECEVQVQGATVRDLLQRRCRALKETLGKLALEEGHA